MTIETHGQDTASSGGTTVTCGTFNTKGSWVELAASTANDNEWLTIYLDQYSVPRESFLIDIGVGAAASESVVVANLPLYSGGEDFRALGVTLPIQIASGSRITVRAQATGSAPSLECHISLSSQASFGSGASSITLGADTANSVGTTVDPGAVANTKGSYSQLDASTSADIEYLVVYVGPNDNPTIVSNSSWLVDIATGAASSESVIVPDIAHSANTLEITGGTYWTYWVNIPSGTRVAARAQCDITDATDRVIDVLLVGFDVTAPSGGGGQGVSQGLHPITNQV